MFRKRKIFQCFIFRIYFFNSSDNLTDLMEAVTCKFSTLFWCPWLLKEKQDTFGQKQARQPGALPLYLRRLSVVTLSKEATEN